jgi:hypothetical protein
VEAPDLFGCVQLPEPASCFGPSESAYGPKQRERLIEIIRDEKLHGLSWPDMLKSSFSPITTKALYGSPFLDASLGQVDAIYKVIKELNIREGLKSARPAAKGKTSQNEQTTSSGKSKPKKSSGSAQANDAEAVQLDNILPPEMPTSWVQCESCKKWRRVPWHINVESLPELWICSQNVWDPESASCDVPQDGYDPQVENTLEFGGKSETLNTLESCKIGEWRDVFCIKNNVYYEAQIKQIKKTKKGTDKAKILFHYKGWSPKFDELIEHDSDRIQPHNMFTNPDVKDPRQQEAYQGLSPIKATIRSAFTMSSGSKKRKSSDGSESASKNRKVIAEQSSTGTPLSE